MNSPNSPTGRPDDWKIPSGTDRCAQCDGELQPTELSTAVLLLSEEGPSRRDLCERCGESVEDPGAVFFWRRRLPQEGDRRPVVDYGVLRTLFEHMLQRPETVYRRLCYLVGLVLIRKRHLRLLRFEVQDGKEVMIVRRAVGEPELTVPAPYLSAEDMVETREHLARLLAADLPEGALDGDDPLADAGLTTEDVSEPEPPEHTAAPELN